jgi:flagellar hook assembly protein FlgD
VARQALSSVVCRRSISAVLLAGVVALLAGASAEAETVVVTSPEAGSAHRIGYSGPVSVDFSGVTTFGVYTISVTGPDAYSWQTIWNFDGSQSTNSWSIDPTMTRGAYEVHVVAPDGTTEVGSATFHIDDVAVVQSSVSSATFFPLEQDGHKDFAHFFFRTDARARDTIRVRNHRGRIVRHVELGALRGNRTHEWRWDGRNRTGRKAPPGVYTIRVVAVRGVAEAQSLSRAVRITALPVHVTRRSIGPTPFYPIERDGDRDTTTFRFRTNLGAVDTVQVVNRHGVRVRTVRLGKLRGQSNHAWTWDGSGRGGRRVRPGTFKIRVVAVHFDKHAASTWLQVVVKRQPTGGGGGGGGNCTPGYSPCLINHGGADYDCAGGTGNGPFYTEPGVTYRVTGSDPYGLDGDGDGFGCEA